MVKITEGMSHDQTMVGNPAVTEGSFTAVSKRSTTQQPLKGNEILAKDFQESEVLAPPSEKYIDITNELPSELVFYPQFKNINQNRLFCRPFVLADLRRYSTAVNSGSVRGIVDTVANCFFGSISAYDMTVGDFYSMLYWIRLQSHKKTPLTVEWSCSDSNHINAIKDKKLTEESLKQETFIRSQAEIEEIRLTEDSVKKLEEIYLKCLEEYKISLYPERIMDTVEILETSEDLIELVKEEKIEEEAASDYLWSARIAKFMSSVHGETIQDRIKFLDTVDDPDFIDLVEQYAIYSYHGIKQRVQVACKECGGTKRITLEIDLRKFFPFV